MLRQTVVRLFVVSRCFSTSPLVSATHYDVLGITPKATQTDIKSAYYKLSKIHHPDKSESDESAKKFRALTEAYEVLGNVNLKKMYDKGLIVGQENTSRMDYHPEAEPADPVLKFYKSRQHRSVAPTMDGRRPIYNFDAWSKHHYGDLLQKNQQTREFLRRKQESEYDVMQSNRQEFILYMMFVFGGIFIFLVMNGTADYDKINDKTSHEIQETNFGEPK